MHTVQGRCPACHHHSLFLGEGGHVTCSLIGCPNPTAADDLLNRAATGTGEASERLKHAYGDIHGRLSSYYEDVVGAPRDQAETNAHNLMGEYAEALIQHLKEQQ